MTRLCSLSAALLFLVGCLLEPLPLEGVRCPCADGWVCNSDDICVEGNLGRCAEDGAVVLTDLMTEWVTPNQVRLRWELEGVEALFAYEIEIAESEDALLGGDLLRTVTGEENPELSRGRLLNTNGGDPVIGTTIRGLDPNTPYRIRVIAEDTSGGFTCSNSIGVLTDPPPEESLSLADESRDGANPEPTCTTFETDAATASEGDHYWEWLVQCERAVDAEIGEYGLPVCEEPSEPWTDCWENIRIEGLDYAFSLVEGEFVRAYLEIYVEVTGSDHGYWAELGISTPGDGGTGTEFFTRGRLTLSSGSGWHRYQVPLRVLGGSSGRLTAATLNRGIKSFRVGTLWDHLAIVRIDRAAIRW